MRVLFWHVHGGYADGFVRGRHEYLLPIDANGDGGPRDEWPNAIGVPHAALHDAEIDVVVLQRPEELEAVERLTGRRPGRDLAAVYLEHNTPGPDLRATRHPLADRSDIPIVHVTHFNRMHWDTGRAPTRVVEHGVPDPGHRYTGELARIGVVINDPIRRGRTTGTDLLEGFGRLAPVDVFGMNTETIAEDLLVTPGTVAFGGNLSTAQLRDELPRRRLYVHPNRWTSLGLSLLEAMHLGMPVVALATTEAPRAVPPAAGLASNDVDELVREIRRLIDDPDYAIERGRCARKHAVEHYGLARFLRDWDEVLADPVAS